MPKDIFVFACASAFASSASLNTSPVGDATEPILFSYEPEVAERVSRATGEPVPCLQHDFPEFCSTPDKKRQDLLMIENLLRQCEFEEILQVCPHCDVKWIMLQGFLLRRDFLYFGNTTLISMKSESDNFENTESAMYTKNARVEPGSLKQCKQPDNVDSQASWTAQLIGPYHSTGGNDWHSVMYNDVGQFSRELAKGEVWVTAYAFLPLDEDYNSLGVPPIHIHHEHVTAGQDAFRYARGTIWGPKNEFGTMSIEFDVHGDRQCLEAEGGVACLPIMLPKGFGMKIIWPMQQFSDLNDVRPANSALLKWYSSNIFRWTRKPQRIVARFVGGISFSEYTGEMAICSGALNFLCSSVSRALGLTSHDTGLLVFDPHAPTMAQYMWWGEFNFRPYNLTFFEIFFHTHHPYTADMWLIGGRASNVGLGFGYFAEKHLNLTAFGMTIDGAADYLISQARMTKTKILCTMNQKRWEVVDGYAQARKAMGICAKPFDMLMNDVVTMVSFHKPVQPITSVVQHNQHAFWYGYYAAKIPGERVPNMIGQKVIQDDSKY